jgi:hypothetical protein
MNDELNSGWNAGAQQDAGGNEPERSGGSFPPAARPAEGSHPEAEPMAPPSRSDDERLADLRLAERQAKPLGTVCRCCRKVIPITDG